MTNRYTNVPKSDNKPENVVIIRGGGDLASGTIHRLYRCGYRLLVLECEKPTAIRRMVSFCEAVYDGQSSVEGVLCRKVDSVEECEAVWKAGEIPLVADTEGTVLKKYRPAADGSGRCDSCKKESWNHQRDGRSNRWSWTGICGR